ncbi:MAG TPA: DNA primase, partial [Armatimonadetes bacterium]|nr:DNA primase [Armatimonadota bacterium]
MALPEGFMQELKSRSDIADIVSSYVSLRRRGRNLVGLCPFHSEKTPSFNLYPETGSFYCFGCGAGGDVITFVRRI